MERKLIFYCKFKSIFNIEENRYFTKRKIDILPPPKNQYFTMKGKSIFYHKMKMMFYNCRKINILPNEEVDTSD